MPLDDDDADASGSGPLLPPEDRLWRHPSELGAEVPTGVVPAPAIGTAHSRAWTVAAAASVAGAALAIGCLALVSGVGTDATDAPRAALVLASTSTRPVQLPAAGAVDTATEIAERVSPAIARLEVDGGGVGSALIYRADGYLVTVAHLLDRASAVKVVLADGTVLLATVVGSDPETDIAVIRVGQSDLEAAELGSSLEVKVGQTCVSVGSSASRAATRRVNLGVVRGLGRRVQRDGAWLHNLIQTDGDMAPLASGGALVDSSGAVIGIATTVDDSGSGSGYSTPIEVASAVASDIITTGKARHPWLGVHGTDLDATTADELGVDGGAVVHEVMTGSPAEAAGLERMDVIVSIDGTAVQSMSGLAVVLSSHRAGDTVGVVFVRDGESHTLAITLEDRPAG
jgi:S1-C subfamily serine protease